MAMQLGRIDPWKCGSRSTLTYDCVIATVGYETRARYFAENNKIDSKHRIALGFENRQVLSYAENLIWYKDAGYKIDELGDGGYAEAVKAIIGECLEPLDESNLRICIDISSLSRYRLAAMISTVQALNLTRPLSIDFVYSAARFSSPPDSAGPNQDVGPLPGFAGWAEPTLASTVVVGIGYEKDKALGAVRYLDAEVVWAFIPTGHAKKYTKEIDKANIRLWDLIPEDRRIYYDVNRPYDCLAVLDSFTRGALRTDKVTLLPFGPKLFALNSLLVAIVHSSVAVWRVSTGHRGEPIDRLPNGTVVGLTVTFQPAPDISLYEELHASSQCARPAMTV